MNRDDDDSGCSLCSESPYEDEYELEGNLQYNQAPKPHSDAGAMRNFDGATFTYFSTAFRRTLDPCLKRGLPSHSLCLYCSRKQLAV
jgi:hypothetical protein